jgi:ATP-dependent Clp protease ATP-binding subunit ClpB
VQTTIEDALARKVLSGEIADGDTIAFDLGPDGTGLAITEAGAVAGARYAD